MEEESHGSKTTGRDTTCPASENTGGTPRLVAGRPANMAQAGDGWHGSDRAKARGVGSRVTCVQAAQAVYTLDANAIIYSLDCDLAVIALLDRLFDNVDATLYVWP